MEWYVQVQPARLSRDPATAFDTHHGSRSSASPARARVSVHSGGDGIRTAMHRRLDGLPDPAAGFTYAYAVAVTLAERRACKFTTPPMTPTARAASLSAGVQV
jgi:hypothetical protein